MEEKDILKTKRRIEELANEICKETKIYQNKIVKYEEEKQTLKSNFWCWRLGTDVYDNLYFSSKAKALAFQKRLKNEKVDCEIEKECPYEAVRMMEYIDEDEDESFRLIMEEVDKKNRTKMVHVISIDGITKENVKNTLGHNNFPLTYTITSGLKKTLYGVFNDGDLNKMKKKYPNFNYVASISMDLKSYSSDFYLNSLGGARFSIDKAY